MRPTQEELLDTLIYSPTTGALIWRKGKRIGGSAGYLKKDDGYVQIQIRGHSYYAHQLIWCYVTGQWPDQEIDHRNHVRNDNRWTNLRLATRIQNASNRKRELRGIREHRGKFYARIGVNYRTIHLGVFQTLEEAKRVRRAAEIAHFGEFAGA